MGTQVTDLAVQLFGVRLRLQRCDRLLSQLSCGALTLCGKPVHGSWDNKYLVRRDARSKQGLDDGCDLLQELVLACARSQSSLSSISQHGSLLSWKQVLYVGSHRSNHGVVKGDGGRQLHPEAVTEGSAQLNGTQRVQA